MGKTKTYEERIADAKEFAEAGENKRAIYQLEKAKDLKPEKTDELEAKIRKLETPDEIWFVITKSFLKDGERVEPGEHLFPPVFEEVFRRGKLGHPK